MEFEDGWLEREFETVGLHADTLSRRNVLEGIETRGLTQPIGNNHGRQSVICPLLYNYLRRAERDLEGFRRKLQVEATREAPQWNIGVRA